MSIRLKVFLAVLAGFSALAALIFVISNTTILAGYERQEEALARREVQRVRNILQQVFTAQARLVRDWGEWDDTHTYMQDQNAVYIESNLSDLTFQSNLDVDVFLYIDEKGEVVFQRRVDCETVKEIPFPKG
ncbi:MAG: CHASE4 domain-containing protein, partial [Planctomycetota bacterium]